MRDDRTTPHPASQITRLDGSHQIAALYGNGGRRVAIAAQWLPVLAAATANAPESSLVKHRFA
jgi:hypothetical protein